MKIKSFDTIFSNQITKIFLPGLDQTMINFAQENLIIFLCSFYSGLMFYSLRWVRAFPQFGPCNNRQVSLSTKGYSPLRCNQHLEPSTVDFEGRSTTALSIIFAQLLVQGVHSHIRNLYTQTSYKWALILLSYPYKSSNPENMNKHSFARSNDD